MAAAPMSLGALLATTPADSLIGPLRRYETDRSMAAAAGEAALTLGRLHAARGEYRPAAEAFARAAARLDPARKPEARLWLGFAWLALGATDQARAALDEVASVPGPHRAAARLALAQAWDAARRPDRAAAVLEGLLADDPGEAAPAALDRLATLDDDAGHADRARRLRERLLRDFPRSIEAAAARRAVFSAAAARPDERRVGGIAVVIGSFLDEARARSLASAARSAGFSGATVVSQGQGLAAVHSVRIGVFATAAEAHRAADQAEKALGVSAELTRP
ncbi:MAG: SPOR domain-containing protein [Candidatus Eisenbacteria bacterium]|nr:SPOR domain-containing protein [Candidatus Eisenbacteria bacterium]